MGTYDTRGGTPRHDPAHDADSREFDRWDGPEVHGSLGNAALAERMQDAMNGLADAYVETAYSAWHEIDDSREQDLREAAMAYATAPLRDFVAELENACKAHEINTDAVADLSVWLQGCGLPLLSDKGLGEPATVRARAEIEACHARIAELERAQRDRLRHITALEGASRAERERAEKAERERDEARDTLRQVGNIAHHGGLLGLGEGHDAMNRVRRLTLPWWDREECDRLQREDLKARPIAGFELPAPNREADRG